MTQPHQCRCAICGQIGVITPGLPNLFADLPRAYGGTGDSAYASSRADELAPVKLWEQPDPPQGHPSRPATCVHGYTICKPCKFPPIAAVESDGLPYPLTLD